MGSDMASIVSRNGDREQGLRVYCGKSAILQDCGCDTSRTTGKEVHGYNAVIREGAGCEKCPTGHRGEDNFVPSTQKLRVPKRRKSGYSVAGGGGLRDRRKVQILRITDHGADESHTQEPIHVVLRDIVGVERTYTQAMVTGGGPSDGMDGGRSGRVFCKQVFAAAIAGLLVIRMCTLDFADQEGRLNYLAALSIRQLGEVRVRS